MNGRSPSKQTKASGTSRSTGAQIKTFRDSHNNGNQQQNNFGVTAAPSIQKGSKDHTIVENIPNLISKGRSFETYTGINRPQSEGNNKNDVFLIETPDINTTPSPKLVPHLDHFHERRRTTVPSEKHETSLEGSDNLKIVTLPEATLSKGNVKSNINNKQTTRAH